MKNSERARTEGGFALVIAIFILVLLSGVGSAMLNISAAHQQTATMALLGTRAFQAARSGAEWAVYVAINSASCPAASFALTEAASAGFQVTVSCASSTHVEGTTSRSTLQIQSTAEYGSFGGRDFVSRTLNVTIVQ